MSETLFSPSWYRIAALKPRLRAHARLHRHEYRGEVWYVLQDDVTGSFYRFTPAAYSIIAEMDGLRTVQELWDRTCRRLGDEGPTQGEVLRLLSQLHMADVLQSEVSPDTAELLRRSEIGGKARWKLNLRNPLALRLALVDPDRFLERTLPFLRPLFGIGGVLLWFGVVLAGLVLAGMHWDALTENLVDRVLTTQNLVALYLVFPVIKALHELGHGYAVKHWGGQVHEMGVMFLVLTPVPYVDASAASEFRSKARRVLTSAAGIVVELFIAALAVIAWTMLEPGNLRSLAYNVLLIGSVSTVLFNANPLLRYDGYYMFADLVEIPNLAQRGLAYLGHLFRRRALGIEEPEPNATPGERVWFVLYSVATFIYRVIVYTAIVLFIAGKFFVIGLLLAAWAVGSMLLVPVFRGLRFAFTSPMVQGRRGRTVLVSGVVAAAVGVLLFVMPFPCRTVNEGVLWVPEESMVRARHDGFVARVAAASGTRVDRGQVLIECEDPLLLARRGVLRARVAELESRYDEAYPRDRVEPRLLREEIAAARAELERTDEQLRELAVTSPAEGLFLLPDQKDLPGLHLKQGDLVGYVLDIERPTVRVVVPQATVDLVRQRPRGVQVRMADRIDRVVEARVRREVPAAAERIPSTVLSHAGGGEIATDPYDQSGTRTFENLFLFDVELLEPVRNLYVGGRAFVRFDHGAEPAGFQILRRLRQTFLKKLNV